MANVIEEEVVTEDAAAENVDETFEDSDAGTTSPLSITGSRKDAILELLLIVLSIVSVIAWYVSGTFPQYVPGVGTTNAGWIHNIIIPLSGGMIIIATGFLVFIRLYDSYVEQIRSK